MGSKKYFDRSTKILKQSDLEVVGKTVESKAYIQEYINQKDRYIPPVDFSTASNFARYGLASKYYEDSVKRVYRQYPYDGSRKEKIEWELSSSYLDKWVFDNIYPRTHGWANIGFNWGAVKSTIKNYGAPASASYEYITIKGGPHVGFDPDGDRDSFALSGSKGKRYSNVNTFNVSKNRTSNLKFNLSGTYSGSDNGVTVEFWLRKNGFNPTLTKKEVLFDLWNQKEHNNPFYGRLTLEMTGGANSDDGSCFRFTLQSGSKGVYDAIIGQGTSTTTASVGDNTWDHYAFTFNSSSARGVEGSDPQALGSDSGSIEAKLYVNGKLNHHIFTGSSVANVTGALMANIGALQYAPSATNDAYHDYGSLMQGYGKLHSASLDEFRYWKVRRSSRDVRRFYNSQVGGGTNTDGSNVNLGVYFKFNEGITNNSTTDSIVLDYSGRVSNGQWTGYAQADTARQTGSAILEASASNFEFKDPIIYSSHPQVVNVLDGLKASGSLHDGLNSTNIYNSIPTWIREQDELNDRDDLANLVQIISSVLDNLHIQIEHLSKLKDVQYSSKYKPTPFASRLLESVGFVAPEIAGDASIIEQFLQRSDELVYEDKLYNFKNFIYQNIYNNLNYIYKNKGTEESFRNLIRCFGVDEELIKINLYSDNATYEFEDNYRSSVVKKKYIDFNHPSRYSATVFQATASSDPASKNTRGFISGSLSSELDFIPFTVECEAIFPKKQELDSTSEDFYISQFVSSSIFGVHSASVVGEPPSEGIGDYTWSGKSDYPNFQVYAVRGTGSRNQKDVKFVLTGTNPTLFPSFETGYFADIYDNKKWNLAVRLKHEKHPIANYVSGAKLQGEGDYTLEFYGVNSTLDSVDNEFTLTATIPAKDAKTILNSSKRLFVGAHRTNFTGSVLAKSNLKISSVRYWLDYLPNKTIRQHSYDATNYGIENPYQNAHLLQSSLSGTYVPRIDTLALHWDFDLVSGSDSAGNFFVEDLSSGSDSLHTKYHWFGNVANRRHTGLGFGFPSNTTGAVSREIVNTAKKVLPEVLNSSDMVNILDADVELFSKSKRPSKYYFAVEKSLYQNISEEMLKMFSTVKDFNTLIGSPVYKYRREYKELNKLRKLFFDRVKNTPDVDKFVDFYRWLDSSISQMIGQLVPASAKFSENVRNVVESHILERNKFDHKFPLLEKKTATEGGIEGRGVRRYPWSEGHHPVGSSQAKSGIYWMERAEVDQHPAVSASLSGTNFSKAQIQAAKRQILNRKKTIPYEKTFNTTKMLRGGTNVSFNKKLDYYKQNTEPFGPTDGTMTSVPLNVLMTFDGDLLTPRAPDGQLTKDANENPVPGPIDGIPSKVGVYDRSQLKYSFKVESQRETDIVGTGELLAPYNLYSSSVKTGYNAEIYNNFKEGVELTNLHNDVYGPGREKPMQGPFTNAHVGGNQHRHVDLNRYDSGIGTNNSIDDHTTRPEAFKIFVGPAAGGPAGTTAAIGVVGADYPYPFGGYNDPRAKKARFLRDGTAKRPVNIKNIQHSTASQVLGNYQHDYEVLQTSGRSINNRNFVKNLGISASYARTPITGVVDYEISPRKTGKHVFVSRFSAPGGPEVNSGFLDIESAELSVYNALPFRNLPVREPLRELLSRHAGQFGSSSFSNGPSASFHKVNRNTRYRISLNEHVIASEYTFATGSRRDNFFITRPIPQSDLQYSWVTSSAISVHLGNHVVFGSFDGDRAGIPKLPNNIPFGYTTASFSDGIHRGINFVSASDFGVLTSAGNTVLGAPAGVGKNGFFPIVISDFAGINSIIYEPVANEQNDPAHDDNVNFLGYSNPRGATTGEASIDNYINHQTAVVNSTVSGRFIKYFTERDTNPGSPGREGALNSLILHRQGPYGWPIFKQIQTGRHPVVRHHKKNNIMSVLGDPDQARTERTGKFDVQVAIRSGKHFNFVEPVFTTKYKNMSHIVASNNKAARIKHSYGNKLAGFSNEDLNKKLSYSKDDRQQYDVISRLYMNQSGLSNAIQNFISLNYKESVYPKEKYFGLNKSRSRVNYTENAGYGFNGFDRRPDERRSFWPPRQRSLTSSNTPALSSQGFRTIRNSTWPLGNRYLFDFNVGASGGQVTSITVDSGSFQGELSPMPLFLGTGSNGEFVLMPLAEQTSMEQYFSGTRGAELEIFERATDTNNFRSSSLGFDTPHEDALPFPNADVGMINYYHRPTASLDFVYLPLLQSQHAPLTGSHPTEYLYPYNIPEQSGKNPWYDSYADYSSDIRYMAKDHTIIPEFRISDHMKYYVEDVGGDFRAVNKNYLKLDGSSNFSSSLHPSSSFDSDFFTVYSHSDFLKHFGKIKKDHKKAGITPSKITLTCEGIKKLLPYNGFYPVTRTVQMASLLSQSLGGNLSGGLSPDDDASVQAGTFGVERGLEQNALGAINRFYFAPGIMYNTIKSGIAVDFPITTGSLTLLLANNAYDHLNVHDRQVPGGKEAEIYNLPPNFRLPFEAMVDIKNSVPTNTPMLKFDIDKYVTYFGTPNYPITTDPTGEGRKIGVCVNRVSWNGKKKSLFEMASNNFLAEIPKFFLEQRGMRTFVSAPEKDFKTMVAGTTYKMDIKLFKTNKFDMIRSYFSASTFGNDDIPRSYHGRYFGPPFRFHSASYDDITSRDTRALYFSDPAYAPYTPPYFYGDAVARISFTPSTTKKYTLDEIFAAANISYFNTSQLSSSTPVHLRTEHDDIGIFRKFGDDVLADGTVLFPSGAEKGMMHVSSSVNLIGKTRLKKTVLDAVTGQPQTVEDPTTTDFDAWVISPKFECPTLNFYDVTPNAPQVGATGMWGTYGEIPSGSEGIFISLEESTKELEAYGQPIAKNTGSLADVLGFTRGRQRIGEIAQKTKIQEAIVAIPFLERANGKNKMVSIEGKNFFGIEKQVYFKQKKNLELGKDPVLVGEFGAKENISSTSVSKMIQAMDKYYFPPFLDFLTFEAQEDGKLKKGEEKRNAGIDPFVVYLFEFETELDKQDLADIWQGVMAKPMMRAEKQKSSFSHGIDKWEFFHGKDIPDDIRWMVFKVKQKAEKSYFDVTADNQDDARFKFDFKVGEKRPEYNYNWPYDFCSLVELAKIDADVEFKPNKDLINITGSGLPPGTY